MRAESEIFYASARDEPVNGTFERGHVEPALLVFAEAGRAGDLQSQLAVAARPFQVGDERAQLALAEVGVDVAAAQAGQPWVADDVAADDRAAVAAAVVV